MSVMNEPEFKLLNPPIVEAILDIECDLPPGQQLAALEAPAREFFCDRYPNFRPQFVQEHQVEFRQDEPPKLAVRQGLQAFQFLQEDEKQLVQVRVQGFSFNRLSPYTSFDDYLPEIERTWRLYAELASPVQVRLIRLRYINRILLPMVASGVQLEDYFKVGPRLPDEDKLKFVGFLNQYAAVEAETGHQVNIVSASAQFSGNRRVVNAQMQQSMRQFGFPESAVEPIAELVDIVLQIDG